MVHSTLVNIRNDTPGCHNVLHLNNAGAALPPTPVINAIKDHLDLEASIGGYEAAEVASDKINRIYDAAAKLINCLPEEIAFTESATRAWDMAFYSLKFQAGDQIITCQNEYGSNYLAFLQKAIETDVQIKVLNNDSYGQLDVNDLKNKLNNKVKLIAITHVPSQGGIINPVLAVGKIAKQENIPYLLDTTQSIGQMPIDVKTIGCDFLCATGRKYLRGPRGTGFLYIQKNKILSSHPPFIDLRSAQWITKNKYSLQNDARRFETWEQNMAAKIGLGVAIDYAMQANVSKTWERIQALASHLRESLKKIPSIELQDLGQEQCGIVTFTCKSKPLPEIKQELSKRKINVSLYWQEYARLDLGKRNLPCLMRTSVHYYNTEDEIEQFCRVLKSIL